MRLYVPIGVAGLLLAWSTLTVFPATNVPLWLLAIGATEFGHYLALLALGWCAWCVVAAVRGSAPARGFAFAGAAMSAAAALLFLRPVGSAWWLARDLPAELDESFAGTDTARTSGPSPLSVGRLVWPSQVPDVAVETHVFAYADSADALKLDFYRARGHAPVPCLVVIHGGGWDAGDRREFAAMNRVLAHRGYAVAAISYRLAPRHPWPAQREDTLAALAWLKARSSSLGVDPTRFVLFGRSAGGQIASAVGYSARDPAIRGVVAYYAPHDMPFVWSIAREDDVLNSVKLMTQYLGGPPDGARVDRYHSASAQALVVAGRTPPTLLVHGRLDELVWAEHSRRLAARLREARIPSHLLELPWGTHGLDFNRDGPGGQLSAYALGRFLAVVAPIFEISEAGPAGVPEP